MGGGLGGGGTGPYGPPGEKAAVIGRKNEIFQKRTDVKRVSTYQIRPVSILLNLTFRSGAKELTAFTLKKSSSYTLSFLPEVRSYTQE